MITRNQEKLIKKLHTKNGRLKHQRCLVEGQKVIDTAGSAVEFTFSHEDTDVFDQLVTTETPQDIAAVAHIPTWRKQDIVQKSLIVVLDHVQDPGNVGSILRLCLGFDASLVLLECADVTSPKVVRSSVGALFQVPWQKIERTEAAAYITSLNRAIYRLEKNATATELTSSLLSPEALVLLAGSEGLGITLEVPGTSLMIKHNDKLESLNVAHSLAIAMAFRYAQ